MVDSKKPNPNEENTLVKPYEELEKSRASIINNETFPLLEIVHGPKQGAWFSLATQTEVTLGRAPTNAIILEDNSVSRAHCVIQFDGNEWSIRDIGSRNGSFVNGKKIYDAQVLHHLNTVKIGIYTLRFLEEPTEEAFVFKDEQENTEKPEPQQVAETPAEPTVAPVEPQELIISDTTPPEPVEPQEEAIESPENAVVVAESQELAPVPPKKRSKAMFFMSLVVFFLLLAGVAAVAAYYTGKLDPILAYFKGSEDKPAVPTPNPKPPQAPTQPVAPTPPPVVVKTPIVLEVTSAPIPANIFYEGNKLGVTPFKISQPVPLGQNQEISAEFFLKPIQEKITEKLSFQAKKQDELVNLQFKPKLGSLKVQALPKLGELYLEAQYENSPTPKTIKLEGINYTDPVYLPYGRYKAEIRVPEKSTGAAAIKTAKYRREFVLDANNLEFILNAPESVLQKFPAKIASTPSKAELLVDGKKVGETPFEGDLPMGRHKLVIRKEGYNDFEKEISVEVNVPFEITYNLETSPAGAFINQGRTSIKKGQYNEAINQLAEALKRNPEQNELVQVYMLLGEAFLNTKTYDQALSYYEKAINDVEYGKRAKLGKARALHGLGQTSQALVQVIDVFVNTQDVKLKSDAENTYNQISPNKSVLYIISEPSGAPVSINGNPINQETPVILSDLMIGSYRIGIQKPGFKNYETRVTVPVSAIKPVVVKLEPEE